LSQRAIWSLNRSPLERIARWRMIRRSGNRFADQIMRHIVSERAIWSPNRSAR
jgi:hypothetical protein